MATIPYLFYLGKASLRRRLLTHFFTHPSARLFLREIAALLNLDPANLSRELGRREREEVFHSEVRGRQKYFSLNPRYPLYQELRSLILKTEGAFLEKRGSIRASLYVMAGPNGAGKTTFAKKFLPGFVDCREFVNADLIAGGIAPLAPAAAMLHAGRFLLERIRVLGEKGIDFAFETTLADKTYLRLLHDFRRRGYEIHLFFLWIRDLALSLKRIEERVRRGGHDIPEPVVRRRFQRGLQNLFHLYQPLLDSWILFDNSGESPHLVAYEAAGKRQVADRTLFDKISTLAGIL
jgi:predicted ABC-type ATPase